MSETSLIHQVINQLDMPDAHRKYLQVMIAGASERTNMLSGPILQTVIALALDDKEDGDETE